MLTLFRDALKKTNGISARDVYQLFSDEVISSILLEYIAATHSYHDALECIRICMTLIDATTELTTQELDYLHDLLTQIQLDCLYHLNYWQEYIERYDSFIPALPSTVKCQSVYETVKNKQDQLLHGTNVESLKCKTKRLTEEELQRTNEYFYRRLAKHVGTYR